MTSSTVCSSCTCVRVCFSICATFFLWFSIGFLYFAYIANNVYAIVQPRQEPHCMIIFALILLFRSLICCFVLNYDLLLALTLVYVISSSLYVGVCRSIACKCIACRYRSCCTMIMALLLFSLSYMAMEIFKIKF